MKTILVDAVHAFVLEGEGIYEPMHKLLEEYPNPKILLTGANDEQMKYFGMDESKMPYPVFTLKHNPEKTDPEYYKTMLEKFGIKADEVVYFEHNRDAVDSAKSIGIKTHYYDAEKKDLDALKTFLDENL